MTIAAPQLRPYQAQAIDDARQAFREGARSVVIVAPTGAGKSVLFAEIAQRHIAQGGRVLIVAHRRELVRQAQAHLARVGIDTAALVGGKLDGSADAQAVVAAVQTLVRQDETPHATMVLWDECHHIKAASFLEVLRKYPDAAHVGFTATPERSDRSPLGDVFARMVVVASVAELTRGGYLVPCVVYAPSSSRGALAETAHEAYLQRGDGRRAIVFCANVEHAKDTASKLQAANVPAEYVDGSMRDSDRAAVLARFASGETRVVTNCNLITEGFDVPACSCVVIARGCSSVAMYLQIVGRALRPEQGKRDAIVLDLRGAVHEHGMPDADRAYSLEGKAIRQTGERIAISQCLACGAAYESGPRACPRCGEALPPPPKPRLSREELGRIMDAHPVSKRVEAWQRLQATARERGYSPGWAWHRYRVMYGGSPPRA